MASQNTIAIEFNGDELRVAIKRPDGRVEAVGEAIPAYVAFTDGGCLVGAQVRSFGGASRGCS